MKNYTGKLRFWGGVLTSALVFSLAASALAASGVVSFGAVNLSMYGNRMFAKGSELTASNGESIPSSVTYTDAKGGLTTYLPISYMSKLLDTPLVWDAESGTIMIGQTTLHPNVEITTGQPEDNDAAVAALPLDCIGKSVPNFTEISPLFPEENARQSPALLDTEYRSVDGYSQSWSLNPANGEYFSVTVTNHSDKPLVFFLGRQYTIGQKSLVTRIPAGETVTRTFIIDDKDCLISPSFSARVSYFGALPQTVDITVSAVQFDME